MKGLMPKEHGAYVQLGFPLLTGLILGRGDPGAVAFAVAGIALFLANEPLTIARGGRGVRLKESLGADARRRLLFLAGVAAGGGIAAALLAPPRAWLGALIPAGLGLLLLPLIGTRELKSIAAEIVAAGVFSSSLIPLALSGGASGVDAGVAAGVWFAAILPAIFAVHAVKAALRKRPGERWVLMAAPAVAATVVLAATAGGVLVPGGRVLLAPLPPALLALGVSSRPPHPRNLKRIGWAMAMADTITLVLLLVL